MAELGLACPSELTVISSAWDTEYLSWSELHSAGSPALRSPGWSLVSVSCLQKLDTLVAKTLLHAQMAGPSGPPLRQGPCDSLGLTPTLH